jgi:Flp pilus assembly pilin Flp
MQIIDYVMARFHHGEEGQTMAEYAVVLAVITVVIIAALTALSGGIKGALGKVTAVLA